MNIGDYSDVQIQANQVGDEVLREVLVHAGLCTLWRNRDSPAVRALVH
jgi:hypothetical protein